MIYRDVPWKARDEKELLTNITNNPYKLRKTIKLKTLSEEILMRTLVNEEKDRISWEDLFKLFAQNEALFRTNPFGNHLANKENSLPQKPPAT